MKPHELASESGLRVHLNANGSLHRLLGLRRGRRSLWVDPVLPRALDGLRVGIDLADCEVDVEYPIRQLGHGPTALLLNGRPLAFEREPNPYRAGGAEVSLETLRAGLVAGTNRLVVELR